MKTLFSITYQNPHISCNNSDDISTKTDANSENDDKSY